MADKRLRLLVLAAAGLGALLWWDMQSAPETPDVVAVAGPARRADGRPQDRQAASTPMAEHVLGGEMVNPLTNLAKESLRDITQRPLFTPTRRPRPAPAPSEPEPAFAPPPTPPSTPDHILLGVVRDGDRAIALLRGRSDGRTLRVETGDTVGGWAIEAVDAVSVRLARDDGATHELRLAPR
jgi:hypothetical protein